MSTIVLNDEAVEKALPHIDVFSTIESMFAALGRGEAVQPAQVQTLLPHGKGDFINYSGVWESAGVYGIKTSPFLIHDKGYTVTAWTLLMSLQTGKPLLLIDSARLTLERTAATTAVAVKHLAKPNAKRLAVIGTGSQALAHIRYAMPLRNWKSIRVWSPRCLETDDQKREAFEKAGLGCLSFAQTKKEALEKADVILLCTSAAASVIEAADIEGAPLITSISTNVPGAREIDPAMLASTDVYCDCTATTATVAGEMKAAIKDGLWSADQVKGDLGALVNGACPKPEYDKPVFFRSIGQGLEDIAVALAVYEKVNH